MCQGRALSVTGEGYVATAERCVVTGHSSGDRESCVATAEGYAMTGHSSGDGGAISRQGRPISRHIAALPARPAAGTAPSESSFLVSALMVHHYQRGAWYPRGGSSELAFHAVPVIERAGGAVLVRAPVTRVLVSAAGTALGEPRDPPHTKYPPRGRDGWGHGVT